MVVTAKTTLQIVLLPALVFVFVLVRAIKAIMDEERRTASAVRDMS